MFPGVSSSSASHTLNLAWQTHRANTSGSAPKPQNTTALHRPQPSRPVRLSFPKSGVINSNFEVCNQMQLITFIFESRITDYDVISFTIKKK